MKRIWIIIVILCWGTLIFGEDFKASNRGLSVLEINTSPVSSSLMNGYSVFGHVITSFLDNPSMLAATENINMVFNHEELGFDIRRDDIYFSKKVNDKLGIMMGIGYFNGGSIELRGIVPQDLPYSTTSFSDFIAGGSVGYEIYKELKVGVGFKFISQYSYIYSGTGVSFDGGVLFSPYILKGMKISVVFNNFGPMINFGETQKVAQPSRVRFAMGRRFDLKQYNSDIGISIGGYSKYYVIPYSDTSYSFSDNIKNFFSSIPDRAVTDIDFDYIFNNRVNLRVSYLIGGENTLANIGLGILLNRFRFDYCYTVEKSTNGTHRMSIGVNY
ncbi:MAG: hypothetical protein GWP03_01685 [Proteobacteria bacterium]|nr:hypothetical protein [Pseudomonadota bacterium]